MKKAEEKKPDPERFTHEVVDLFGAHVENGHELALDGVDAIRDQLFRLKSLLAAKDVEIRALRKAVLKALKEARNG